MTPSEELPRVQVLILTYNRAGVVKRAVDSALAQDYPNREILVLDNGSTDETPAVLAEYRGNPLVRIVRYEENRGSGGGRNRCLENAVGTYALYLDSDDELLPGAITAMVTAAEQFGDQISMVMADCVDAVTGVASGWGQTDSGLVTYEDMITGRLDGEFLNLFRLDQVGSLRFDEVAYGSEAIVWYAMMKRHPAYYLRHPVRVYHTEGLDRISREHKLDPAVIERKRRAYAAYLEALGADVRQLAPNRYASMLLDGGKWEQLAGNWNRSASMWLEAVAAAGLTRRHLKALVRLLMPRPLLLERQRRMM